MGGSDGWPGSVHVPARRAQHNILHSLGDFQTVKSMPEIVWVGKLVPLTHQPLLYGVRHTCRDFFLAILVLDSAFRVEVLKFTVAAFPWIAAMHLLQR